MKCEICGSPAEVHHIITRGSGGTDHKDNLLNLCRKHHTEIHTIGRESFSSKYEVVRERIRYAVEHKKELKEAGK